jgi:Plavaka transposase
VPLKAPDDWSPYRTRIEFEAAEFAFKKCHMSARNLDFLCDLMAATLAKHHDTPPFADHKDLHNVIDATQLGDVPWQCFSAQYTGERPEVAPPWMDDEFEVWYRDPRAMAHNIIANPDYKDEIDYVPYREYDASDATRRWKDFMSGDWAWKQAVRLPSLSDIARK